MFQEANGGGEGAIDGIDYSNTNASILIYKREKFFYE